MNQYSTSLTLIGMPGAGKSTIGILLAKTLAKDFVDTDLLIQNQQGKRLQDIVDNNGYLELRDIEEKVLLQINHGNHIIATGGSAVYSELAMHHLKTFGQIIFLDVPLIDLEKRINDFDTRGLARRADQSFTELFNERHTLYQKFADITIDCTNKSPERIIEEIIYQEAEEFGDKDA